MKAQFWSIDLVFAIIIFTAAMLLLSLVWLSVNNQFSVTYGYGIGVMQSQLSSLTQRLQTPGSPPNWNTAISENDISTWGNASIGLAHGNTSTISQQKLLAAVAMSNTNYQQSKQALGIGYDYYITVSAPDDYNVSFGLSPSGRNPKAVQVASVPVTLDNGETATMRAIIWTNTSFGVG